MEKSKLGILIFVASIVGILLTFFFVVKTNFTVKFIVVSALFGPGMGISYGLENPTFRPGAHLFTLLIVNILAVALIYVTLSKLPLDKKFENKFLDMMMQQVHGSKKGMEATVNKVSRQFESYFGNIGFYIALGLLTFAYGAYVTGALSFFLMVKMKHAIVCIFIGSVISIVFWWHLAIGTIPFITPTMIFVAVTGASILMIGYGLIKEKRIVKEVRAKVFKDKKTAKQAAEIAQSDSP